jgi:drug/metabolite transporter (DMT)-like permease
MRRDPLALAAILVLATIWGYNWVVIKVATHDADAYSVATIRCAVGALCLLGLLVVMRRSLRPTPFGPTLILGLVQTTVYTVISVTAIATGGAGKTAILTYTMPFFVVLMAWPVLHERVSRSGWIALALAAVGLALVLTPLDLGHGFTSKALALTCAVVWAASAVYAKRLRTRHDIDLLALTTWQMLYGSVVLVALGGFVPHHVHLTRTFLFAMLYVAVPGTGLAWLLWMFMLSRLTAGVAGISSLLTPVIGVLSAWLQLGERPGTLEIIGMCCIVVALVVNLGPVGEAPVRAAAAIVD